ncbi:ABC transporter ATP-binding protein [Clostridium senegalense]
MENILEVKNLTKAYKNFKLEDISFTLPKGYIMGFIGQNGAGKTTTIKLIMNLVKKDSGEIKVFEKDNLKFEKEIKEQIGFVYDEGYFYEHLSLEDNAKLVAPFYKEWSFDTFYKYANKFGLNKGQKFKELSKGMKMKYSLSIALSHNAKFIIMDEPTAGLDPVVRAEVLNILRELIQDENVGVLLSTHITSDLEKIADYITYINNGKIVFSKSKEEVLDTYKIVKGDISLLTKKNEKYFEGIRKSSYGFEALTSDVEWVKKEFKDSVLIQDATLELIMILKRK